MIPLADENPSGRKPYVVYGLIIANAFVYLVGLIGLRGPFGSIENLSMIPYSVIHDMRVLPLVEMGRLVGYAKAPAVGPHPQWITIFTSMFMHGGLLHIGFNMLYLWVFGNNIEDALGHIKFLLFYLACGILAALAHIFANTNSYVPTVGASGAIAGVLGAYIFLYPGNSVRTLLMLGWFWDYVEIPAIFVLGVWFLTQILNLGGSGGMQGGGVAYWAHVGGFVAGIALIAVLGGRKLRKSARRYPEPYPGHRRWR